MIGAPSKTIQLAVDVCAAATVPSSVRDRTERRKMLKTWERKIHITSGVDKVVNNVIS